MKTSARFIGLSALMPLATGVCLRPKANRTIGSLGSMPGRENEVKELNLPSFLVSMILLASVLAARAGEPPGLRRPPAELAGFFAPQEQYRSDFGTFRSPIIFTDSTRVQNRSDW